VTVLLGPYECGPVIRYTVRMDSILLIDKPKGITSARAVALIKKRLKVKVGHTGTLDPLATGLLIVLTGKRTKQAGAFLHMGTRCRPCWA